MSLVGSDPAVVDWQMVEALGTWFAAIFTLAAVFVAWWQLRRQAASLGRTAMLRNIADEWTEIYATRNSIMNGAVRLFDKEANKEILIKLKTLAELEDEHPTYDGFFRDNREWPEVRKLCSFYEKLGIAVNRGLVDPRLLFILVTVENRNGDISRNLGSYIAYLRGGDPKQPREPYRKDIYVFCDYILNEWEKHRKDALQPYPAKSRKYKFNPPR